MIRTPRAVVGPVMPQVTGTWGHKLWCEAQSRNYPLPCPGHWVYHKSQWEKQWDFEWEKAVDTL